MMIARLSPPRSMPPISFFYGSIFLAFSLSYTSAAPANDNFNARVPLVGTGIRFTASNVGATKEPGEPNHAKDLGGASVWWSWIAPASGVVNITTADSDFDTLL